MNEYRIFSSIEEIDKKMWDEFVLNHPKGNFFYSKEFYYSFKESEYYDSIVLACFDLRNGQILGLLLATIQREYKGVFKVFTSRCIIYGEPLVINDNIEIQIRLIEYLEKCIKPKVILTQYRFLQSISPGLQKYFVAKNYTYEPYLNIINDTSIGIENLWNGIERRRKQNIKRAMNYNFSFGLADYSENIDVFYPLLCETYKTIKGLFPPKDYFLSLKKNVSNKIFKVFELKYRGDVIVSFTAFLSKNTLYANYIGNKKDKDILMLRPVDYFYWELLKWCCHNGVQYFNWLGAGNKNKDYGVRDFKIKYGGKVFEPGRMKKYNNWMIKMSFDFIILIWKKIK